MTYVIGIDPGLSGALALLNGEHCIALADMPVLTLKKSHQVNAAELSKILRGWEANNLPTAYVEQVGAMPGQGVVSMFGFGVSFGIVLGVLGALQIPVILVSPAKWKRKAGLLGKPKDFTRTMAQRLYPGLELARKKDCGRADALLIARFAREE